MHEVVTKWRIAATAHFKLQQNSKFHIEGLFQVTYTSKHKVSKRAFLV